MMNLRACLQILGVIVLLVGLGGSLMIYRTAGDDVYGVLGYEEGDGTVYAVMPEDSKLYQHNLELYGGKAGMLADVFRRWFVGLWVGKSLAFTVAFLALFLSSGLFYAAWRMMPSGKGPPGSGP